MYMKSQGSNSSHKFLHMGEGNEVQNEVHFQSQGIL